MTDEVKTEAVTTAANTPATSGSSAIPAEELGRITDDVVSALKTVYDPEIPADIYELGLIYKVDIADDRAVTVDMTLHNNLRDSATRRYYFDTAFLAVLPGATGYSASWAGRGRPTVSVARRTSSYTLLRLNLAQDLSSGKTARYRLAFDLRDPGGKATRDLRIGDTLVSFPVWAFASDATPGS